MKSHVFNRRKYDLKYFLLICLFYVFAIPVPIYGNTDRLKKFAQRLSLYTRSAYLGKRKLNNYFQFGMGNVKKSCYLGPLESALFATNNNSFDQSVLLEKMDVTQLYLKELDNQYRLQMFSDKMMLDLNKMILPWEKYHYIHMLELERSQVNHRLEKYIEWYKSKRFYSENLGKWSLIFSIMETQMVFLENIKEKNIVDLKFNTK